MSLITNGMGRQTFNLWNGKGATNLETRFNTMHLLLAPMITRLQDGISRNLGSIVGRRKRFVSSPKPPEWLLVPPGLSNGYWREESSQGVRLTTHLLQVPRLRMRGFIPPLLRFLLRRGSQLITRTLTPIRVRFVKSVLGRKME